MLYVVEIIKVCYEKGYILVIVIGGSKFFVEKILDGYGLWEYISIVVVVEDVIWSKLDFESY